MKDIDDMDKAIEDIMERFRSGEMDDLEGMEEHSKERCALIMREAIEHADGEITVSIKQIGEKLRGNLHVKGNNAAVLVALYILMDRVRCDSPGITFEDIIGMMRYMEESTDGSERS